MLGCFAKKGKSMSDKLKMRRFLSFALAATLASQPVFWIAFSSVSVSAQEIAQPKLTNADIVDVTKSGLAETVIVAKIKASPTNFDTSPGALQALKQAGISDAVLLAMVESSKPIVFLPVAEVMKEVEITVPDGTEIEVELKNNLSGEDVDIGDKVDFTVVRDIQVDGVTVINKGASATARITVAKKAGHWGKTGKLEWAMNDVQTVSGDRIPVRFTKALTGGSKGGTVAVAAVATTILLGPVGLLWGLKKGKKAEIAAGNKYSAFSDGISKVKTKTAVAVSLK
jgi:hypothetical protein